MLDGMRQLVVATRNGGKAREFAALLQPLGLTVRSLADLPAAPEVMEDGATFAENALKKARTVADWCRSPVLADDSGLCVDALHGEPGVYSARYAGEQASDADNNAKLLRELGRAAAADPALGARNALSRARFVCSLALYEPDGGRTLLAEASCEGVIVAEARGDRGFGYDPLFLVPELGKTMAELSDVDKNRISHRAKAMQALVNKLRGAE